jgi:polar amino acid transport system substrate-binding protein
MRRTLPALLILGAVALAACGDDDDDAAPAATTAASPATTAAQAPSGASAAADCAAGKTIEPDKLTIATGDPAFPPYVINDATPEDGQGFEAAVAMAVARELGFTGAAVTWVRTPFDAAIAPGPKNFDFNLQQYGITPERAQVVDFSEGYYTAPQAVFGLADSPAASASTIDDLKALKIGVAAGTTSITYVEDTIQPDQDPLIFNDNAAAKTALESNQIDAVVSDLPTAIYITTVEIEGTKVFGQIEGSGTDEWGLLLAKDNPLTECVDLALQTLKDSGELDQITTTWMSDYTQAPVISAG